MPSPLAAAGSAYSASSFLRIFLAKGSLISVCLGTASMTPFLGFIQSEWRPPSRLRKQPRCEGDAPNPGASSDRDFFLNGILG
jgi:hypothetical protein